MFEDLLSVVIFDPLNILSVKEKFNIVKSHNPTNPLVIPVGVELRHLHVDKDTKCPYCGNTSPERDKRGNCVACGGAR